MIVSPAKTAVTSVPDQPIRMDYFEGKSVTGALCRQLCKNGWTDRDAIRAVDLGWPKKVCIRWGCTLTQPGEYDWTVHGLPRCGLMSNYFDYLFTVFISTSLLHLCFSLVAGRLGSLRAARL